ncbi:MAG: hypothetical protein ACK4L7_10440 [Flavobacteriales bacterium]
MTQAPDHARISAFLDAQAAEAAGVRSILIPSNAPLLDLLKRELRAA